ncbi:NAD(P)H-quinone oxidoreductase [Kineosporia sp. J2-2]|uniref:NAD(P)H-quinone oxidoreductase n=1 Tax=Kineosporia corallincola TaxID=2835133 RepID=A0ABS5TSU1_9ACTN|nr:NAD(P)H-quinone oxidoreductase [Kineosporia corallincola]MBT0773852.1 NAD(P)H-quinone oxidoreductase [Kineosporia corallincola]
MKAVVISEFGDPDVLRVQDVPDPTVHAGQVLIDVAAAGVNRADLLQRAGHYPPPAGAPEWPGIEVSGTISAVGADVDHWTPGDRVCALLSGGGYAERVAVPQGQVLPLPRNTDLIDAAALPEVTATVWSNVFMAAGLRPGEVLLVHGGSSGIGTMAVQLAVQVGARVAVTCGTDEKLERCRELGAEILINYRSQDFVQALKDATDGHGADVVLDNMGASYLSRNLKSLAYGGRIVVIGMQGGAKAEINLNHLMSRRAALIATTLRARPDEEKETIMASVGQHVWPLLSSGLVRPVIHERLPLAEAARAHRIMAGSQHIGKILLTV